MAFPNVPNVPGVPALPRDPLFAFSALSLLTRDLSSGLVGSLAPKWGIFLNGAPVVVADSVISFDFKADWSISDYPVEQGAFESYDKVEVPFVAKVRFATGGAQPALQAFLDSITDAAKTLSLYEVITPEKIYENVNISHYDYRRTASAGLGLIVVDVWLLQIRQSATPAFSNTKSPSAAGTTQTGVTQGLEPTAAQSKAVSETPSGAGY